MKYVDEFRDGRVARKLAARIASEVERGRGYRFMEFCGGHTHAISRYGLEDLLPANVRMIHGPGCPVCVLPVGRIDMALALAGRAGVTLCTYGDLMRVPGSSGASLLKAKAAGADVRMVYSTLDALEVARRNSGREVVFFAIGFETTTPPTALAVRRAKEEGLGGFSVFCNHVLTPAAMAGILGPPGDSAGASLDGFVGPAHVSAVIGTRPYEPFADDHGKAVVISGFEPLDVLQSISMLVRQVNEGRHEVENQFARAVTRDGNTLAKTLMEDVFERREAFEWRGLGELPWSALRLREEYGAFDAERRFELAPARAKENPACACGAILRGEKRPVDCKLFGKTCTPDRPVGSCMVSSEGACAAHFRYGRFRDWRAA